MWVLEYITMKRYLSSKSYLSTFFKYTKVFVYIFLQQHILCYKYNSFTFCTDIFFILWFITKDAFLLWVSCWFSIYVLSLWYIYKFMDIFCSERAYNLNLSRGTLVYGGKSLGSMLLHIKTFLKLSIQSTETLNVLMAVQKMFRTSKIWKLNMTREMILRINASVQMDCENGWIVNAILHVAKRNTCPCWFL